MKVGLSTYRDNVTYNAVSLKTGLLVTFPVLNRVELIDEQDYRFDIVD